MEEDKSKDAIYSKQVIELFTVANEYCLFFDKAEEYSGEDIFDYFHKIAPLLYLKGSLVPPVTVQDPSYNERYLTEERYEALYLALKDKFGNKDAFYILNHNYEATEASIAECMTDIYQDMKDFVWLYRNNNSFVKENGVAQIKELFENRWGIKTLNTLKAIHGIKFDIKEDHEFLDNDDII